MTIRLTDAIPLRTTAALGDYDRIQTLPRVMGKVTIQPIDIDGGRAWFLSDAPIAGVDAVTVDGKPYASWQLIQTTDRTGRAIAYIETLASISQESITVTLRGERHPTTGEDLDRPDLQLWYLLSHISGYPIEQAELDDLRATLQTAGIITGGVIDDHTTSLQTWVDRITQGSGLAWSRDTQGWALAWPPTPGDPTAELKPTNTRRLVAACEASSLATKAEVEFDYNWAEQGSRKTLTLNAPDQAERYGEIIKHIELPWIHDARAAEAAATRWLQYYSRPVWTIAAATTDKTIGVGDTVSIDHPHSPISLAVVTRKTWTPQATTLSLQGAHGDTPTIETSQTGEAA